MTNCLVCKNKIKPFISFGKQPIANGFLTSQEFQKEYFYNLAVGFCPICTMVQLTELVDREKMFHTNYAFFSSTSRGMAKHFEEFAQFIKNKYLKNKHDPFVIEMGSNDGIMLRHFAKEEINHLGIEPSKNVARVAMSNDINTTTKFFDEELAKEILSQYGQADAFLGANVMCHIPYIHSVIAGIKLLLKPKGVLVFEDPYVGDIVQKTSYDQIYDEHAFYFSVRSINNLMKMHKLEVIDVAPQNTHGGSMRYTIGHIDTHKISPKVKKQLKIESALGLHRPKTYASLAKKINNSREGLITLLKNLKKQGKRVVAYGATSKSTTITNYCKITPDLIEFISDTTPIKQGKYSPGTHIPVKAYEKFQNNHPDYALLFAWNHAKEIMEKERQKNGYKGKWIVYIPKVKIIKSV